MKKRLKIMGLSILIALTGSIGAAGLGFIDSPIPGNPILEVLQYLGIDLEEYGLKGGNQNN